MALQDLPKLAKAKMAQMRSSMAEKKVGKKVVNKAMEGLHYTVMGEDNYNKAYKTIKDLVKQRKPDKALEYGKHQRQTIFEQQMEERKKK